MRSNPAGFLIGGLLAIGFALCIHVWVSRPAVVGYEDHPELTHQRLEKSFCRVWIYRVMPVDTIYADGHRERDDVETIVAVHKVCGE